MERANSFSLGLAVAVIAFLAFLFWTRPPALAQQSPQQPSPVVPRYQIVNPTPDVAIDTMLLDTYTGRSWKLCDMSKNTTTQSVRIVDTGWCEMLRSSL